MDKAKIKRVVQTLAPLAAVFPNWKADDPMLRVYAELLGDLDDDMLQASVLALLSDPLDFMPTPGTIRAKVVELEEMRDGVPTVYEAWSSVLMSFGSTRPSLHSLTKKAVDQLGGLNHIGMSDNAVAERARFADCYRDILEAERKKKRMMPSVRVYLESGKAHFPLLEFDD